VRTAPLVVFVQRVCATHRLAVTVHGVVLTHALNQDYVCNVMERATAEPKLL